MTITAPRVAAVQSECRPGLPPLIEAKKNLGRTTFDTLGSDLGPRSINNVNSNAAEESDKRSLVLESLNFLKKCLAPESNGNSLLESLGPHSFDNLPPGVLNIHLLNPFPRPSHHYSQYVCETASRLLFLSVHWARQTGPVFMKLPYSTQVSLMRSSWSDLFLLCLAQCREQISIQAILTAIVSTLQGSLLQDMTSLAKDLTTTLKSITLVLNRIEEYHLEPEEFAYLKLCCLFSPGEIHYEWKDWIVRHFLSR
jgi:hypothetical protein